MTEDTDFYFLSCRYNKGLKSDQYIIIYKVKNYAYMIADTIFISLSCRYNIDLEYVRMRTVY